MAPFNLSIAIKEWKKVKVYKNPDGENEEVILKQRDIAVNSVSKNLLEITLPAVKANEVYRLRLEAGAVSEEGKDANVNEIITPKDRDITIGAAPALTADPLYLGRQKIVVTFTAPIRILNRAGIKYQLAGKPTIPNDTPKVINTNQLEIPLNTFPTVAQVYRIDLAAGALGGGKNKPSVGNIQSGKLTVTGPLLTNVKPAFTSKTQLSVSFPVAVALVGDGLNINVQKKDDEDDDKTAVDESNFHTVSSRTIEVDDENPAKINITLTGGEKITPYTQVWKVIFPSNTVEDAESGIANSVELTTNEVRPTLTDLYRWEEVKAEGEKWSARWGHTSVVFQGKIWVMGGRDKKYLNDVWSSADGANWTESTPPGDATKDTDGGDGKAANWWTARRTHTSVVFKDKIWVLGGRDSTGTLNDVWSSADGSTWTESTPPGNARKITSGTGKNWWGARFAHTSVVFPPDRTGKRIWVMGGTIIDRFNDVWSSADGETWTQVVAAVDWTPRYSHASVVFKDKIRVTAGFDHVGRVSNSVWSSSNGRAWIKGTATLPNKIYSHITIEYNDRLWSLGVVGNNLRTLQSSFLSSADPATGWTAEDTLPEVIHSTKAVVFKNRIWLLGGVYGESRTDKVWKMGLGPS